MKHPGVSLIILTILSTAAPGCVTGRDFPQLRHIKARASPAAQAEAAQELIVRLIGARASLFTVKVNESIGPVDCDTFELSSAANGHIQITGTTGVAVAMGFYYYLKYFCSGQRTWAGQQTQLPEILPVINSPMKITTNDKFRYYQNVCSQSYTMAFWNWTRWEQEIDWMALHGINLPLAFVGQEAIFQKVFLTLGLTQADLDEYFTGPAFLAWARMGNIEHWGGPLPQTWIANKMLLQQKILNRMRSLGMIPVLPAFSGHVPRALTRVFPDANVTRLPAWNTFNTTYSGTYLLEFQDPLFIGIGQLFIEIMTEEFGTDHVYNCDTFNEMNPVSNDPSYISAAGKAVFEGMLAGDPQSVWLMQGWLFEDYLFWQPTQVKALVTSVPLGRMIILDLCAETLPVYQRVQSYYGQPFIWCMLHNFGGTMELYGAVDNINKGPFIARAFPNSTMIGIGLAPEGIHQNEVIYEFMTENAWRTAPRDVQQWVVSFAQQRYGVNNTALNTAWQLLMKNVYNCTDNHLDIDYVILTRRPWPHYSPEIWYNPEELFAAWGGFINASLQVVETPLLQVIANAVYASIINAFNNKNITALQQAGQNLTSLLNDMEILLASSERFLVGHWIAEAKSWSNSTNETLLYEYNARNQITLWGPNGEIHDYASKQWSGVTADYYIPRWQFFIQWLKQLIQNGSKWDDNLFGEHVMQKVEAPWTLQTKVYPTEALGSTIQIATYFYEKYKPAIQDPVNKAVWEASSKKLDNLQHLNAKTIDKLQHPYSSRLPLFYRKQQGRKLY
ncbi:unnamed protein product [Candidula unifasciata]|uniref:Alpha-N-acetylglucosaminidase n=1 Tax=Candidula unifasciata TaxID=100452 RepID=A0A8S3ZLK7_9EUPU|nr:unnamed protein product [Candidula unifasciata]